MSMKKNRFPIYIISKGRWNRRPTANYLEEVGLDYFIVVEADEYEEYKSRVKGTVLILPQSFKDEYDCFWNDGGPTGSGPARNFCWEHSIQNGYSHHWLMDDNIESIQRYNHNMKIKCMTGTPFYVMEDFVLRYKNIAMAGPNYSIFCPANEGRPPLYFNTRIYSTLLIRNEIPFRWRGRYNEDTDLSLRALKNGWCTVQFNLFLQEKRATGTLTGGNTDEIYQDGTYEKSKMIEEMHPDVAQVIRQYNRWHHHVNYNPFKKNTLIRVSDYDERVSSTVNNYGLKLERRYEDTI